MSCQRPLPARLPRGCPVPTRAMPDKRSSAIRTAVKEADLAALFRTYQRAVYHRALQLLGNPHDAEEATQEVFIRVLRSRVAIAERESPGSWLRRITTNYCINQIRNRERRRELYRQRREEIAHQRHETAAPALVLLQEILGHADDSQARAAVSVYLHGCTRQEAAESLGVSRRTVGNLLERLSATLRAESGVDVR